MSNRCGLSKINTETLWETLITGAILHRRYVHPVYRVFEAREHVL
jgi:hypothetical protein